MDDLNSLYHKLRYLKKRNPQGYNVFIRKHGRCSQCGTTVDVRIYKVNGELNTYCNSCIFIKKEGDRLGMSPSLYLNERQEIITEIISRVSHRITIMGGEMDVRNRKMYELHLSGRSHAHIGELFGISRERVRQIVYKIKKS